MLTVLDYLATHVGLLIIKNPDLGKFGPRITVSSSKLTKFIISPSIQIQILINDMPKVCSDRQPLKLQIWHFTFQFHRLLIFLPYKYPIALIKPGVIILKSRNLFEFLYFISLKAQIIPISAIIILCQKLVFAAFYILKSLF